MELDDNHPVLKLKHFNAGLVGWEEKNTAVMMPLISTAESEAVFAEADGSVSLHYHLAGKKLTCTVHHMKDGKSSDETFTDVYKRQRQSDGTWLLENTHKGRVHFELEDGDNKPSRWNTLRALRVLRWYEGRLA